MSGPLRGLQLLPFRLREFPGKRGPLVYFPGFFPKVEFLHKKRDTRAILLKRALVRISFIQNTQIRGQTITKRFGKVDTFLTYQCPPGDHHWGEDKGVDRAVNRMRVSSKFAPR